MFLSGAQASFGTCRRLLVTQSALLGHALAPGRRWRPDLAAALPPDGGRRSKGNGKVTGVTGAKELTQNAGASWMKRGRVMEERNEPLICTLPPPPSHPPSRSIGSVGAVCSPLSLCDGGMACGVKGR